MQVTPISSRFTRSPDTLEAARARTSSPFAAENSSQVDQSARQQHRIRLAQLTRTAHGRRRAQTSRRTTGVDGLGDRERSLSPEGWDTLLATLAPDPRPPSVNTSFASGTGTQSASQSAGQPPAVQPSTLMPSSVQLSGGQSSTLMPPSVRLYSGQPSNLMPSAVQPSAVQPPTGSSILPDGFDDAPVDPGCDSGCEHSDIEGDSREGRYSSIHQFQRERSRFAQHANRRRGVLQPRTPAFEAIEHPDAPSISERQALNRVPMPDSNSMNPWMGRASIGAGEQENTHVPRHARIMTFSPGEAPAEEDLSGMQHIVRSMAQREDIPEEWWLEAGLSRTLSQQGTN